ncbi:MAG: chemotaxis protein CheC [Lachnospiraceae bacterium]|nr:chemotaxis protein CheC [Lachnospiraceae bacterium]
MSNDIKDIYSRNLDILSEIGNIGAGNATTALAQIIGNKVNMDVPQVRLLGFNELTEIVGGAENIVIGIMCRIEGDLTGMMMFMLEKEAAHRLIDIFMMDFDDGSEEEFSELKLSALHELGNIIVGAYLNALAGLTGLKIIESIPHLSIDMAGAILSVPAIEFGKMGDEALLIESRFFEEDKAVSGYFILIPDVPSYDTILKSLHIG